MLRTISVDPAHCTVDDLREAAAHLRAGGVVAFPTDTTYGFACDPYSSAAVQAVFDIKGRASDVALPLIGESLARIEDACGALDPRSRRLAAAFWPGPLTLVIPAPAGLAPEVLAGRDTVAVRVPDHLVARRLCEAFGGLLTATSANRSGEPAIVDAKELDPRTETRSALRTFPEPRTFRSGEMPADRRTETRSALRTLLIDAGRAPGGPPSTIVDARQTPPVLIRAGAVDWNRVLTSIQE